ncbi:hypothetical protein [Limnohabitans sp.]|uniref:hypothetical protein n=1 Tax=Limnohabitans sp. TaxID=1907725 RepID=UPI0038B92966
MRKLSYLIFFVLLSGCVSNQSLTLLSQPSGAYITELGTGKVYGVAPLVVQYDGKAMTAHKDASGCYLVKGFEAKWVSGATSSSPPTIRLCASSTNAYNYQFSRDANTPGLEKDLDFAMRQSAVRAQQQQAKAIQDAAAIQAWSAFQAMQPKPAPIPAPISCNSYAIGNSVQTNCR